jgi:hypothetical protein
MVSNLLLLPSLLLSLEQRIANKKTFKKPAIQILPKEEVNIEDTDSNEIELKINK